MAREKLPEMTEEEREEIYDRANRIGEMIRQQKQEAMKRQAEVQKTMTEPAKRIWKVSEIEAMSVEEWKQYKGAIRVAIAEGRIEVDVQHPFSTFRLKNYTTCPNKPKY
jgi:polyphosphate kinase 2 (PPK2 family)